MEASELPLFEFNSSKQPISIDNVNITSPVEKPYIQNIEKALNSIFLQQQEPTKTERARGILGELSRQYTDEQLKNVVSDFEYLATQWLDTFEKQIFNGVTLSEILQ